VLWTGTFSHLHTSYSLPFLCLWPLVHQFAHAFCWIFVPVASTEREKQELNQLIYNRNTIETLFMISTTKAVGHMYRTIGKHKMGGMSVYMFQVQNCLNKFKET
jgi:hypothetical protein